jgi:hypothetical protein
LGATTIGDVHEVDTGDHPLPNEAMLILRGLILA